MAAKSTTRFHLCGMMILAWFLIAGVAADGAAGRRRTAVDLPCSRDDGATAIDLRSGRIASISKDGMRTEGRLTEGDLVYTSWNETPAMMALRGGSLRLRVGNSLAAHRPDVECGPLRTYRLRSVPCRYRMVTGAGDRFDLQVVSAGRENIRIEYCRAGKGDLQPDLNAQSEKTPPGQIHSDDYKDSNDSASRPLEFQNVRILRFPADRSLGELYVRDPTAESDPARFLAIEDGENWDYVGPAMGEVRVPSRARVRLNFRPAALHDLSSLPQLEPDSLCMAMVEWQEREPFEAGRSILPYLAHLEGLEVLWMDNVAFSGGTLPAIRRLHGLKALRIVSATLVNADLADLEGLDSLESVWLASPRVTDDGLYHFSHLPALRELRLSCPQVRGPGFVSLATLPSLQRLHLPGTGLEDEAMRHLAKLSSLHELSLRDLPISDRGLTHLSGMNHLGTLDLFNTQVTDEGLAPLRSLPALRRVNLAKRMWNRSSITDAGLEHLASIDALEDIELPGNITDLGLERLVPLKNLRRLKVWQGSSGPITDMGLARLGEMQSLESLSLSGERITDKGLANLSELTNLRVLSIYAPREVTDAGLANLTSLTALEEFCIARSRVTVAGLRHLNALPRLRKIHIMMLRPADSPLDLSGLPELETFIVENDVHETIHDEDLATLAGLTRLKRLEIFPHKTVTDAGLAHLAGLTGLEHLAIGGPGITDEGLAHLANLKRLRYLEITGSISDEGFRRLETLSGLAELRLTSNQACSHAAQSRLSRRLPNLMTMRVIP